MQDLFSGTADDPFRLGMEINRRRAAAFSGYRASKLMAGNVDIKALTARLHDTIKGLHAKGYTTFITGMSDGFDMIAAKQVLRLKARKPEVELIAIIPFRGQESSYSAEDRSLYNAILSRADHIHIMAEEYHGAHQYLRRNDMLLHNASHLICYFDGRRGGTMYTHNRALKLEISVTNIL